MNYTENRTFDEIADQRSRRSAEPDGVVPRSPCCWHAIARRGRCHDGNAGSNRGGATFPVINQQDNIEGAGYACLEASVSLQGATVDFDSNSAEVGATPRSAGGKGANHDKSRKRCWIITPG